MKKLSVIATVVLCGCFSSRKPVSSFSNSGIGINGKIFTSLYQQKSAEYRALCLQAFNVARYRVDNYRVGKKPPAIITDIDETLLDNSPYEVHQTIKGEDYEPNSWYQWTDLGIADTIPGGYSFLRYAASKGIQIFYITNREERERKSTLSNLMRFGFPDCDDAHLIMRQNISSKELRRKMVSDQFDVVLYLGDNLSDFSDYFDHKTMDERKRNTDLEASEFGNRFIILPNPVYGDWEPALYKYNYSLKPVQKDSVIKSVLKSY